MNGSELNKIKNSTVKQIKKTVKNNLFAVIFTGSASYNEYKDGWSDLDFLIVVEQLNLNNKRAMAKIVLKLENNSGIHHGFNVISKNEFFRPILPDISLDGKTLQTLVYLKKYPNMLIYSKSPINLQDVYAPNAKIMRSYSLNNIGMFLRRNRQTLTRTKEHSVKELKELLKKEMRASLIITKLAVQYFTGVPQENYKEILKRAKFLFSDFEFSILDKNFEIINKWRKINNKKELLNIFSQTDDYIENFTYYVFKKTGY